MRKALKAVFLFFRFPLMGTVVAGLYLSSGGAMRVPRGDGGAMVMPLYVLYVVQILIIGFAVGAVIGIGVKLFTRKRVGNQDPQK